MKKYKVILLVVFCFFFSCNKKDNNTLRLSYTRNNNELILKYENNTSDNIVFPVSNTLEFGDKNFKDFSTHGGMEGSFPITVYAIINPNQFSKNYQEKLDSIRNNYFIKNNMANVIEEIMPGDGYSIFYLKRGDEVRIKYKLNIKQPSPKKRYSSRFKQNYYPFNKVLKNDYPEGKFLKIFSKLNLGTAKFVGQPVIEDSLFLRLSEKDSNY